MHPYADDPCRGHQCRAYAMGLSRDYGSVTVGKVANFFLTVPMPSVAFMPYAYTTPLISRIFLRGEGVVA